ncbi:MAG TPA: Crp/Fnr family transcriptional regulator [Thermomicrobiales bacterium]|nr:Crp/Fnr family transcriptional regulator [Thermomicrobiales bacterium]
MAPRRPPSPAPDFRANRLLAVLPPAEYDALAPHLAPARWRAGETIQAPGERLRDVYFPLTGVASVVVAMADGALVDVGTIGCEGLVGLPSFHGADHSPLAIIGQVPGAYARLPVVALREAAAPGSRLHALLARFAQALYVFAAQVGACNRLHPVEQRCARWLLATQDRAGADTFPLTHELLGEMLGVTRVSVTRAAGALQRAGLIAYRRGVVTVCDRAGLEGAACECYGVIAGTYARLLGDAGAPPPG